MKEPFENSPRWREHSDQAEPTERIIGQDLRAIKTPAPLSGPQMARIAAGLRPSRARHSRLWLVLATSLILVVATAASAASLHLLPGWLTRASAPQPAEIPAPRPNHRKPSLPGTGHAPKLETAPERPAETPTHPTIEAPPILDKPVVATPASRQVSALVPSPRKAVTRIDSSAPALVPSPPVPPPMATRTQPLLPPSPTVPLPLTTLPPPSAYVPPARAPQVAMLDPPRPLPRKPVPESPKPGDDAEASKLLADAIRLLRADGHPQFALALLDRQATRLDQSPYRHEALLIRVEALLALKRDADLLRLLDGMPLAEVAASRTLLATRGRLRAAAKRCAEAVADFDRVLAETGRKDRQALLGRAQCREAQGDLEGAKADRERYRQESQIPPGTTGASRP